MGYTESKPNPELKQFEKSNLTVTEALNLAKNGHYKRLTKCSGMWNNYVADTDYEGLKRLVEWAALTKVYESKDGTTLYLHGYSINDMY